MAYLYVYGHMIQLYMQLHLLYHSMNWVHHFDGNVFWPPHKTTVG